MHKSTRAQVEDIELKIFDVGGRLVKDFSPSFARKARGLPREGMAIATEDFALMPRGLPRGASLPTEVTWVGKDNAGRNVKSGVYFCTTMFLNFYRKS